MTRKSFYAALRRIAPKYKWFLDHRSCIRTTLNDQDICPINLVYYHKTGTQLEDENVPRAYNGMFRYDSDGKRVMCAADNEMPSWANVATKRQFDDCRKTLRKICNV